MSEALTFTISGIALLLSLIAIVATLGTMREIVLVKEDVAHNRLAKRPYYVGSAAPAALLEAVQELQSRGTSGNIVALLVSGGCGSCHSLIDELMRHPGFTEPVRSRLVVIEADSRGDDGLGVARLGVTYLSSRETANEVFEAAQVYETPTAILLDNSSMSVIDHRKGAEAEWIIHNLQDEIAMIADP